MLNLHRYYLLKLLPKFNKAGNERMTINSVNVSCVHLYLVLVGISIVGIVLRYSIIVEYYYSIYYVV